MKLTRIQHSSFKPRARILLEITMMLFIVKLFTSCSDNEKANRKSAEPKAFKDRFVEVIRALKAGDLDTNLYSELGIEGENPDFEYTIVGGGGEGPGGSDMEQRILINKKYLLFISGSTYKVKPTKAGIQPQKLSEIRLFNYLKKNEAEIFSYEPIYPYWGNGELKYK